LGIKAGIDEFSASARMNQYETGKHHPDLTTISRLCDVLNVPVAFMYSDDDDLAHIIATYPTLSPKDKQSILAITKTKRNETKLN